MSITKIRLVKKIVLSEELTFDNSLEIYNKTQKFINEVTQKHQYKDMYDLKKYDLHLAKNTFFNIKKEVEYYFFEIKNIPNLSDSLNLIQIKKHDFFIDIDNPDNVLLNNKNTSVFFISSYLELITNFGNKILVRDSEDTANPDDKKNSKPFLVELNDTVSIFSYDII